VKTHPKVPRRRTIAARDRVVHGYFEVDLGILPGVTVIGEPVLADQVRLIQSGRGADMPEERATRQQRCPPPEQIPAGDISGTAS